MTQTHTTAALKLRQTMTNTLESNSSLQNPPSIYNQAFWQCYIANVLLVAANSLTFRFAEFVAFLGGDEGTAGAIVGVGMAAAVLSRFGLGQAIDHYGTQVLWRISSVLMAISCLSFLAVNGPIWTIYPIRILFAVSMACMFSCSMVYIQKIVPAHKRTEVIASLGSSGFVGMIIGPQIGDVIFTALPSGWPQFAALFGTAALLSSIYLLIVWRLTGNDQHDRPQESVTAHRLLWRYWPGQILLIAIILGGGLTIPTVFLTRYATHLGLRGIGTFFLAYSSCAFTCRLIAARWLETIGLRRMVLIGMAALGSGQFLFLLVSSEWHLVFPAMICGVGHALLFPIVVSVGAGAFPQQYRGTGTTLILGFTEVGIIIAAPILGSLIDLWGFSVMFVSTGFVVLTTGLFYFLTSSDEVASAYDLSPPRQESLELAEAITEEPLVREPAIAAARSAS